MKHAVVLQHVAFEDLGTLQPLLSAQGWQLQVLQAGVDTLDPAETADLLVVLGGPVSVNDVDRYPFLNDSIALLQRRLQQQRPTLGICLGAQLMAAALGARVAPGPVKEIGWAPLTLTDAGRKSVLAPLGATPVLHWHGDNCELPSGCERLAFTQHCPVQAFFRTPSQLALQFHLETEPARFESWLVGHTVELGKAGIDPREIRRQVQTLGPATRELGGKVLAAWLDTVVGAPA